MSKISHVRLARFDPSGGAVDGSWTPTLTGNFYGAWALATQGTTALFVGGAFTSVSGVAQPHFAEFE